MGVLAKSKAIPSFTAKVFYWLKIGARQQMAVEAEMSSSHLACQLFGKRNGEVALV